MLKSITVTNAADQSLKLELAYPWDSRVIVKSIDGLTPTKGTINTNALATSDGSVYNSARQEQRNLVLNLRFFSKVLGQSFHNFVKSTGFLTCGYHRTHDRG